MASLDYTLRLTPNQIRQGQRKNLGKAGAVLKDAVRTSIMRKGLIKTGRLLASIRYRVRGNTVTVTAPPEYSSWLEEGTRRMSPHPFFYDAIDGATYKVRRALASR